MKSEFRCPSIGFEYRYNYKEIINLIVCENKFQIIENNIRLSKILIDKRKLFSTAVDPLKLTRQIISLVLHLIHQIIWILYLSCENTCPQGWPRDPWQGHMGPMGRTQARAQGAAAGSGPCSCPLGLGLGAAHGPHVPLLRIPWPPLWACIFTRKL